MLTERNAALTTIVHAVGQTGCLFICAPVPAGGGKTLVTQLLNNVCVPRTTTRGAHINIVYKHGFAYFLQPHSKSVYRLLAHIKPSKINNR